MVRKRSLPAAILPVGALVALSAGLVSSRRLAAERREREAHFIAIHAVAMEAWTDAGVPEEVIFLEARSRSTQENALYSREIMQAHGWQTAIVVSDRYHLLRATWLFSSSGINATTTGTAASYMRPTSYARYVLREVAALQWQGVSNLLNLPYTHFPIL